MHMRVRECAVRVKEKMMERLVAILLPNVCDEHSGAAEATVHGPENFPGGFSEERCDLSSLILLVRVCLCVRVCTPASLAPSLSLLVTPNDELRWEIPSRE